jgi:hypothetical protein
MNLIHLAFYSGLSLSSMAIFYQDFKDRLVSVWVIILFGCIAIGSVIYFRDLTTLLYNTIGTLIYGSFIWLSLKLYLYLKFKKNKVIINQQLGLADVLIFVLIGLTFNLPGMILFFCFGFIFSLISFVTYSFVNKNTDSQSIPLAGLLVLCFVIAIIVLNLVDLKQYIDCSFVIL